eukprot:403331372
MHKSGASQTINDMNMFKSRILPDIKIQELNKLISDPEFIDKHPEVVEKLINGKNNGKSINKQQHGNKRYNFDSKEGDTQFGSHNTGKLQQSAKNSNQQINGSNYGSQTSRTIKQKKRKQNLLNDTVEDSQQLKTQASKTRDLSFAKLIKTIQESSNALKASKSGKSIFNSTSSSIMDFQSKIMQQSQINLNQTQSLIPGPINKAQLQQSQSGITNIPIFTNQELMNDFNKLLKLNGPKFQSNNASKLTQKQIAPQSNNMQNSVLKSNIKKQQTFGTQNNSKFIFDQNSQLKGLNSTPERIVGGPALNQSQMFQESQYLINDEEDHQMITTLNIRDSLSVLPTLNQIQSQTYDLTQIQNLQPPIGLTARLSPRQLRDKFRFPEFQNKILESESPSKKKNTLKKSKFQRSQHKSVTLRNMNITQSEVINGNQTFTEQNQLISPDVTNHAKPKLTLNQQRAKKDENNTVYKQSLTARTVQPSLVQNAINYGPLPDIIKFCRSQNLAFNDAEKMHYEINMCKKNHRIYERCLKQCFKSNQLDGIDSAIKQLGRLESVVNRQQKSHIKESSSILQNNRDKSQHEAANNIEDLQSYAEEIKKRKQFLKEQSYRENTEKKLLSELSNKIDDPNSSEKFSPSIKHQFRNAFTKKLSKFKTSLDEREQQDVRQKLKLGLSTQRVSLNYKPSKNLEVLNKTQMKMQKSKNRLSNDLMKVLEKVQIDRPSVIKEKAQLLLKDQDQVNNIEKQQQNHTLEHNQSILNQSTLLNQLNQSPHKKKLSQSQLLDELKRLNKRKQEKQRSAYMSLLDYIKLRAKQDRDCRVSEQERRIFDTLKVIFDGNWQIHSGVEFMNILQEIQVVKSIDEQLYFFLWYAFECLSYDTQILDEWLTKEAGIDLSFAKQRKQLLALMINEHQQNLQFQQQQSIPYFDMSFDITQTNNSTVKHKDSADFTKLVLQQRQNHSPNKKSLQEILIKTVSGSSHALKRLKNDE